MAQSFRKSKAKVPVRMLDHVEKVIDSTTIGEGKSKFEEDLHRLEALAEHRARYQKRKAIETAKRQHYMNQLRSRIARAVGDVYGVAELLEYMSTVDDGFEGGATRFYLPREGARVGLDAHGIQPVRGAALCFPQGNTATLVQK